MDQQELLKKLLEAGVHFGHQTRRWNPKMKQYIFGQRSGIYIIDLEKTVECLQKAREFARDIASKGGKILFIGTKKQAQDIIKETASKIGMYSVTNRWMGGLLTNFETVRKSIGRLEAIEKMEKDGTWENLKKKETVTIAKAKVKLLKDLSGIRDMKKAPDLIFIVDPKKEDIAVKEAIKLNIPVIAIIDTNCDPDVIDFPIPGNDDALKAIRLISSLMSESIVEGQKAYLTDATVSAANDQQASGEVPVQEVKEVVAPKVEEVKGEEPKAEEKPATEAK